MHALLSFYLLCFANSECLVLQEINVERINKLFHTAATSGARRGGGGGGACTAYGCTHRADT
jgi:hypothetical protein